MDNSAKLFRIYNHYRVVVGLILVGSLFFFTQPQVNQFQHLFLFEIGSICYLALNIFIAFLLLAGLKPSIEHVLFSMIIDVLILNGLLYSSTGTSSGIANLIIISVAAGNILLYGKPGVFLAALSALCTLSIAIYMVIQHNREPSEIVQSGILGIIYFAAAFILQNISRRISASEKLAQLRAKNIAELEMLNHQIIQRMQTGIIVTDEFGDLRMMNHAASLLLEPSSDAVQPTPTTLPIELKQRLDHWRLEPQVRTEPFKSQSSRTQVQANFTRLDKDQGHDILIFLEDTSKVAQQAQQMKLASLGRLTAGIAHEIRNPLGAISHATQLLSESVNLDPGDKKMTDIILRHANRMNGIIENVLQLSRRKQPDQQILELNTWLQEFIDDYLASGGIEADITFKPESENAYIRFDSSQLEQVLTNLIDNGLRYSKQKTGKSTITLEVGSTTNTDKSFINIIDQGPGISSDNIVHVFEPFFTTNSSGTGLGLYLSREICEANQAHLDYINDSETNSCFRITFAHYKKRT
ncbi:sensor histidine kinase [Oleiphilus messinensis]|nr:ATP-binding protein [Oleiphilus messinensis]